MTEVNELYHFGIKGQRWGVRRFQNPNGTLTSDGRKRYRAYKSDLKEYNKLNRHVAASQKHLKEEGVMLNRVRDVYERKNKVYQKEMAKSSGFLGLKAAEKADRVARAQANADSASSEYSKAASSYGLAKKISKKDTKALVDKANSIIKTYGKGSIKDVEYKTVKIGQNKAQKLLQGAPITSILGRKRDTDTFVKTGLTLADMPVVGNIYTSKYIANEEFKMKTKGLSDKISDNRQLGGKKGAKFVGTDDSPTDYFDGYSSVSNSRRNKVKEDKARERKEAAEAKKAAEKAYKEAASNLKFAEDEFDKVKYKNVSSKSGSVDKNVKNLIDKNVNNISYVTPDGKRIKLTKTQEYSNLKKEQKALNDARKALEAATKRANKASKSGNGSIKSRIAGAAISTIGAGAAAAAAAAAGPIAGYAAKQGIKAYAKRKRKEKIKSWFGHSATYRVVRSDELYHHGIKGQRWGVRRFQNKDKT